MDSREQAVFQCFQNVLNTDKQTREKGENDIKEYVGTDYYGFFLTVSRIIVNSQYQEEIRKLGATVLKNLLKSEEDINKWLAIDLQKREEIKNNLLTALGTQSATLQNCIGIVVAFIARCEIPYKQWPSIIQILSAGASHSDINNRMTSLIILQNLLNELEDKKECLNEYKDQIFNLIFNFYNVEQLKQNPNLFKQVLQTTIPFIPFLYQKMQDGNFRFNFFNFIYQTLTSGIESIYIPCFQILTDISKSYYELINDCFDNISNCILNIMSGNLDIATTQAIIFLTEFGEEEINRKNKSNITYYNYINKIKDKLLSIIANILLNKHPNNEDDLDDDTTPYSNCEFLLNVLSRLIDQDTINFVFKFIQENINSTNPLNKAASVYAFYSILETTDTNAISTVLPDCINMMVNLMQDPNEEVRENVSICIKRIGEFHGFTILSNHQSFNLLFNAILQQLEIRPIIPKILIHYVFSLHHFFKVFSPKLLGCSMNNFLNYKLQELISKIFEICYADESYNPDYNVCEKGFLSIGTIIEHCSNNDFEIISQFMDGIFVAFERTTDSKNYKDKTMQYDFQVYISNLIVALSSYGFIQLNKQQGQRLYSSFTNILNERRSLYDEALMGIASLIEMMNEGREELLDQFSQFFLYGLSCKDQASICKNSILSVCELLPLKLNNMSNYIERIMGLLNDIINFPDADPMLRVNVINLYTDLFHNFQNNYGIYFPQTLNIVMAAIRASLNQNGNEDENYINSLNSSLLEYLECSIRYIHQLNQSQYFYQFLPDVMRFINNLSLTTDNLSFDMAISCGGIIADLCHVYGFEMNSLINEDAIKRINFILKGDKDKGAPLANYLSHVIVAIKINSSVPQH